MRYGFKIGDKVKTNQLSNFPATGKIGNIIFSSRAQILLVGVECDGMAGGHDLEGALEEGSEKGFWYLPEELEKVPE